jgi:hypothetical protein
MNPDAQHAEGRQIGPGGVPAKESPWSMRRIAVPVNFNLFECV